LLGCSAIEPTQPNNECEFQRTPLLLMAEGGLVKTLSTQNARMNPVLVEAFRGDAAESFHRGRVAVIDADRGVVAALGDIDARIFPRSAVKLLQALPLIESGAAERFQLSNAELSLACASHNGEPAHANTALSMLRKAGLDESALECGAHWPYFESASRELAVSGHTPTALHNNCSGKHAGFVCLGCTLTLGDAAGWLSGYVKHDHPVMREVGAAIEAATGSRLADAPMGIDGCSIPTYALPLRNLALAFARAGTGLGLSPGRAQAAKRLREAVAAEPFMTAGTGRFDTRVMQQLGARVFCKVGAEGVYCAALPELGLGVALKMDDGNNARACEVAMAAVIEALLPLPRDEDRDLLASLSCLKLRNWRGIEVGKLSAATPLRELHLGPRGQ
jgi:L-asparaginase II